MQGIVLRRRVISQPITMKFGTFIALDYIIKVAKCHRIGVWWAIKYLCFAFRPTWEVVLNTALHAHAAAHATIASYRIISYIE